MHVPTRWRFDYIYFKNMLLFIAYDSSELSATLTNAAYNTVNNQTITNEKN